MLNYEQIKEIIKSIDSSSLRVFELESGDLKLKLSKNEETLRDTNATTVKKVVSDDSKVYASQNTVISTAVESVDTVQTNEIADENLKVVKSPLVGTYYSSSSPDSKDYVEVGSKVKKGDVLCIVEAMKIMNEITAEYDGEIVEVLRQDEDIVEFGMELFKIK